MQIQLSNFLHQSCAALPLMQLLLTLLLLLLLQLRVFWYLEKQTSAAGGPSHS